MTIEPSAMEPADEHRFHAVREDFTHLKDREWLAMQRMADTMGEPAVGAMSLSLNVNEKHATIAKFIQYELDESKKNTLLLELGAHQRSLMREIGNQQAKVLRQQGSQQSELLKQQIAGAAAYTPTRNLEDRYFQVQGS